MYDFKTLSAYDFENLVRDLLQQRLGVALESFKPGKDGGIDLRRASADDGSLIVQCKHYAESGYRSLLTSLRNESKKVLCLQPDRYCVATSVPLSPANKQEICSLFAPYCRSEMDIYGLEDLNNLLGIFPSIERKHYKLWITSTVVMERIIHSEEYNQTVALVETIQHKARLYVQNNSFFDALDILKKYNYCIISGIPGIGKTFLAEILLLEHVRQGFEPVVVRSNVSEAWKMLKPGTKQVFYYDDFLGQVGWEDKLEKNEDQKILDFIRYVRNHQHASFILTTREYILQQARNTYEKLHADDFENAKCIIELNYYTRMIRANILFNHVYFSDLTEKHRRALAKKESLLRIIDHKNYSPRIVEWMTGFEIVSKCSAEEYPRTFLGTLDNPEKIWLHAFKKHISPVAQSILLVLFSFPTVVDMDDLSVAFDAFREQEMKKFSIVRSVNEFEIALDELEGSFVRYENNGKVIGIAFLNPSVRDFLQKFLASNSCLMTLLCESIVFYDQFRGVFSPKATKYQQYSVKMDIGGGLTDETITSAVIRTVSRVATRHEFHIKSDGTFAMSNLASTSPEENVIHALKMAAGLSHQQRNEIAEHVLIMTTNRIMEGVAGLERIPEIISLSAQIKEVSAMRYQLIEATRKRFEAIGNYNNLDEIVAFMDFLKSEPQASNQNLINRVAKELVQKSEEIFDGVIFDIVDENKLDELVEEIHALEESFVVSLDNILEKIEEQKDELSKNFQENSYDWYDGGDRKTGDNYRDEEIITMFCSMFE